MFQTDVDYRNYFFFEKSNMHGLLGTYTDYVNLRFSHIHDYLGSTIIRDSRVAKPSNFSSLDETDNSGAFGH